MQQCQFFCSPRAVTLVVLLHICLSLPNGMHPSFIFFTLLLYKPSFRSFTSHVFVWPTFRFHHLYITIHYVLCSVIAPVRSYCSRHHCDNVIVHCMLLNFTIIFIVLSASSCPLVIRADCLDIIKAHVSPFLLVFYELRATYAL